MKKRIKFDFHGSYTKKEDAVKAEQKHSGAFIVERTVSGKPRFFVMSKKDS